MYRRILVTLEHTSADEAILQHVEQLQALCHSEIILLHVADGWAARQFDTLQLKESEEMRSDREYLEAVAQRLRARDITTNFFLATGDPAEEIIKFVRVHDCDLLAMSTHGHRLLEDIIYGSTATKVRHHVDIPVLLVKVPRGGKGK